jgi:hypothetical protein
LADVSEVPATRKLIWSVRACEWDDHRWERYDTVFDVEWPSWPKIYVIAVLCKLCGRTPEEALGALPIVVPELEYPEPKKGPRAMMDESRAGRSRETETPGS